MSTNSFRWLWVPCFCVVISGGDSGVLRQNWRETPLASLWGKGYNRGGNTNEGGKKVAKRGYPSIMMLFEIEKEEYDYQRQRLQNILIKAELIIVVIGSIISFEIANAANILKICETANTMDGFQTLRQVAGNLPYLILIIVLLVSAAIMIWVLVSLKYKTVNVVKLYNNKVYKMAEKDLFPYLTALYAKCNAYNFQRINSYYKRINAVIVLAIVSIILFGIAYII